MARTRTFLTRRSAWRVLPVLILAVCAACAHIPQQSENAKRAGIEASDLELRTRTVALGRDFLRMIEIAGDSIEAVTTDVRIKRNSLQWKLSSVPAVEEAVLREDIVIAVLDLTAFRGQTEAFLNSQAGAEAFGPQLPLAQRALVRLAPEWDRAAKSVGVVVSDEHREKLRAWVQDHPIEGVPFTRSTLVGGLAVAMREQNSSIGAAVGGMQESLDRMELRVSLLNEFAIKQASWLSQLAVIEMGATPEASELASTLTSAHALIDDVPDLVHRERMGTLEDVERQRLETIAILQSERVILLEAVARERTLILAAVDEQRRQVMRDVDSLRVRVITDEIRVVDHVIFRVVQILAVLLVLLAGAFLLLTRRRATA